MTQLDDMEFNSREVEPPVNSSFPGRTNQVCTEATSECTFKSSLKPTRTCWPISMIRFKIKGHDSWRHEKGLMQREICTSTWGHLFILWSVRSSLGGTRHAAPPDLASAIQSMVFDFSWSSSVRHSPILKTKTLTLSKQGIAETEDGITCWWVK